MDIVFLSGGDTDKSGNTVTALYHKRRVDFDANGSPFIAGSSRSTLSFKSIDAMLAWAAKEHNGGRPCIVEGARVVPAPAAPAAPEKPTKAAK